MKANFYIYIDETEFLTANTQQHLAVSDTGFKTVISSYIDHIGLETSKHELRVLVPSFTT